ncbi:MAG: hypothetical protein JST42_25335 [Bacteroidetes bacterium]|nr:hypothetical protein [Bacteroidota bacterium]
MLKLFLCIPLLAAFFGACDHDTLQQREYKVVVSKKITQDSLREWYEIHEQYLGHPCNNGAHFASAYLCTSRKKDTLLVIDPCNRNKYKKHAENALFVNENVVLNDTVTISIPPRYEKYLHMEGGVIFGTLMLPID